MKLQKGQIKEEPLTSHKILSRPCEIVGSDISHFHGKDYLCTIDYYSNYFEVDSLKEKAATEVIEVLKIQFQHFAESYDVEHVTSSPHYPQSATAR